MNDTLRYITNNFIKSKSYKLVSNYWHVLNIANYKSLSMFGVKKYGSTIAEITTLLQKFIMMSGSMRETVNNLKKTLHLKSTV